MPRERATEYPAEIVAKYKEYPLAAMAIIATFEYPSLIKDPATETARIQDMRARAGARLARLGIDLDPAEYRPEINEDRTVVPTSHITQPRVGDINTLLTAETSELPPETVETSPELGPEADTT